MTSARVGQGVLGLLLDARYGILPYVPVLALAAAGLLDRRARAFAVVLPGALVYYLTVASADNWAGAVCNLGRYFMPVAPLAVVLVGLALTRPWSQRSDTGRSRARPRARRPGRPGSRSRSGRTRTPPTTRRCCSRRAPTRTATSTSRTSSSAAGPTPPRGFGRGSPPGSARWRSSPGACDAPARRYACWSARPSRSWRWRSCWSAGRVGARRPAFGNALPAGSGALVFLDGAVRVRGDEATLGPGEVEIVRRTYARAGEAAAASPLRVILGGTGPAACPRPRAAPAAAERRVWWICRSWPTMSWTGETGAPPSSRAVRATVSGQAVLRFGEDVLAPAALLADGSARGCGTERTRFALRQERCPKTDRSSRSAT